MTRLASKAHYSIYYVVKN